jgi:phage shock protein E
MRTFLTIAVILLIGGLILWSTFSEQKVEKPETIKVAVKNLDPAGFKRHSMKKPGIVVDVRTQEEYDEGHLAKADRHYDLLNGDFKAQLDSLDKDETYYLYCRSGNRSGQAAELMIENGFTDVYNIGGFQDLVDAGLEAE